MPVYFGEMHEPGDDTAIPAVVTVEKGTIQIRSGKTEVGEWKFYEVSIDERDSESVSLKVGGEELILKLREHESFLAETEPFRTKEPRRRLEHEAFRSEVDDGPSLVEELREDVGKEVSSVAEEMRSLLDRIPRGPALWVGLAAFLLAVILLPQVVVGILFAVGIAALVLGAISYVERSIEHRLPGSLTGARLLALGTIAVGLGLVVAIVR